VKLQAEAHLYQLTGQKDKALEAYERLFASAPDNYDFGMKLLRFQRKVDAKGAKKTIAALRKLASPSGESPELEYSEALLAGTDLEKLAGLEAARALADEQGARLVAASALLHAAGLHVRLGKLDDALKEARRAKETFEASGDRDGVIQALEAEALVHQRRKDPAGARRALREAMEQGKHLDSVRSLAGFEENLGRVLLKQGDLDSAEAAFADVVKLNARAGKAEGEATSRLDLALVRLYRGDLAGASQEIDRAARQAKEIDSPKIAGIIRYAEAYRALLSGDVASARQLFESALEVAPHLREIGVDRYFWGEIALVERNYAKAESAARGALATPGHGERYVDTLAIERVLLEALAQQGKVGEAQKLIDQLRQKLEGEDAFPETLMLDTYQARLRAASKKRDEREAAASELAEVGKRAEDAGFILARLRADLERGKILAGLDKKDGQALLTLVAKEAKRRGLSPIVSEAARALQGSP
jgi:tetratricopeptide (TPR) repeat protein